MLCLHCNCHSLFFFKLKILYHEKLRVNVGKVLIYVFRKVREPKKVKEFLYWILGIFAQYMSTVCTVFRSYINTVL